MSRRESSPKGRQITMRIDEEIAAVLDEIRDLASTEIAKPSFTDIFRAVLQAGAPIVRAKLLASKGHPATPPTSDATPSASARGKSATRKRSKP